MHPSSASIVLAVSLVVMGCGAASEAPAPVGDVGDTSGEHLKVACNLSRDDILASVSGDRQAAIQRGFAWYDAQVPYSQSGSYDGYRTDCSGFVSMCWQLGTSYTTADFINDTGQWTSLGSFDELEPADAMVYRSGSSGHIMMFVGWNDNAKTQACVLEEASTAEDMQFRARTTDSLEASGYHAIRATNFGASSGGQAGDGSGGSSGSSGSGGSAGDAQCYCDAACAQYGDCCSDCSGGSGGSSGSAGGGGSSGSAGGGGQCYCDAACAQYGDCCSDCSGGNGGSSGSAGGGGSSGSGGQCYCDAACAQYGDCCSDCSGGSGGSSGGGGSGGDPQCYCDAACVQYGDCCSNC